MQGKIKSMTINKTDEQTKEKETKNQTNTENKLVVDRGDVGGERGRQNR